MLTSERFTFTTQCNDFYARDSQHCKLKEYSSLQDNPYNVRFIYTVLIVHNYFAPRGVDNVLISELVTALHVH